MIFDGAKTGFQSDNPYHFAVPMKQLAAEVGKSKVMLNTVAAGAVFAVLGFDLLPLLSRAGHSIRHTNSEWPQRSGLFAPNTQ